MAASRFLPWVYPRVSPGVYARGKLWAYTHGYSHWYKHGHTHGISHGYTCGYAFVPMCIPMDIRLYLRVYLSNTHVVFVCCSRDASKQNVSAVLKHRD